MTVSTTTRNADLADFAKLLQEQRAQALDLVVPATSMRAEGGMIRIAGAPKGEPEITDEGVSEGHDPNGLYKVSGVADEGIGGKLGIHTQYLGNLRAAGRFDLWDGNVNGWLHGGTYPNPVTGEDTTFPPDGRKFMTRLFRATEGDQGILRALLSDKYGRVDNLDVLLSVLDGVSQAGVDIQVKRCDLTERRMYVKIAAPAVAAYAGNLLHGLRNPHAGEVQTHGWTVPQALQAAAREGSGYAPGQEPVIFAGFSIKNSETGHGSFSIAPELTVKVCANGLTFTGDALRRVHLGARQEEGVVTFSEDTNRKALELVALQTRDAVATWMNVEYVQAKISEMEVQAGVQVDKPADVIKAVTKASAYPQAMEEDILNLFIKGGQNTAGGVMQAVSAAAQHVEDADLAALLEEEAPKVLVRAAAAASK